MLTAHYCFLKQVMSSAIEKSALSVKNVCKFPLVKRCVWYLKYAVTGGNVRHCAKKISPE